MAHIDATLEHRYRARSLWLDELPPATRVLASLAVPLSAPPSAFTPEPPMFAASAGTVNAPVGRVRSIFSSLVEVYAVDRLTRSVTTSRHW
mgnify:CR=1 FL=1